MNAGRRTTLAVATLGLGLVGAGYGMDSGDQDHTLRTPEAAVSTLQTPEAAVSVELNSTVSVAPASAPAEFVVSSTIANSPEVEIAEVVSATSTEQQQALADTVGAYIFKQSCEETRDSSGVTDISVDFYGESSVKLSSYPIIFGVEITPVGYDGFSDPAYFVANNPNEAFTDPSFVYGPGEYLVTASVQTPISETKGGQAELDSKVITVDDCAVIEGDYNPIPPELDNEETVDTPTVGDPASSAEEVRLEAVIAIDGETIEDSKTRIVSSDGSDVEISDVAEPDAGPATNQTDTAPTVGDPASSAEEVRLEAVIAIDGETIEDSKTRIVSSDGSDVEISDVAEPDAGPKTIDGPATRQPQTENN